MTLHIPKSAAAANTRPKFCLCFYALCSSRVEPVEIRAENVHVTVEIAPDFTLNGADSNPEKTLDHSYDWRTLSLTDALSCLECSRRLPSNDDFIFILLKCKRERDLLGLIRMFALVSDYLDSTKNASLGNYFVPAFVECGSLTAALRVFDKLKYRNEYAWTSLIQGHVDCGEIQQAFHLYDRMQEERVYPNSFTFVALLTACVQFQLINKGRELHYEIVKEGHENDKFVCSILVDMYAKCGLLLEAQEVFDMLVVTDAVLWTALISGYVEHGLPEEALKRFEQMQVGGVSPDPGTYVCSLKACSSLGTLTYGQRIQNEVMRKGYEENAFIGNMLVDLYARQGHVMEAQKTFDGLLHRDVVSWNALTAGYSEHGLGDEVLMCLKRMRLERQSPNAITLSCSLKACGSLQDISEGRYIHSEVVEKGLENEGIVGNTLLDMYHKCNCFMEARQVFRRLQVRDIVTWNTILTAYADHGFGEDVLNCFEQMYKDGVSPNYITSICALKICGLEGMAERGQVVHMEIMKQGLEMHTVVGNTLVDMYAKCRLLSESWEIFMRLSVHDVVSWNVVLAGFTEQRLPHKVDSCFKTMQLEGVFPDALTYIFLLKSCCELGSLEKGQSLHAEIMKDGFESNSHVASCLVVIYSKCGAVAEAQEVFDNMIMRDVVTWTALIGGYAEYGFSKEAINILERMCEEGVSPNAFTYVSGLRACCKLNSIYKGQELHADIVRKGYQGDAYICSSLIDMYCKCGFLEEAHGLLYQIPSRDIISWTALISGYVDLGLHDEACICFNDMQLDGLSPDVVVWNNMILTFAETDCEKVLKLFAQLQEQAVLPDSRIFVSILKACGDAVALETGKKMHAMMNRIVSETSDVILTNALVDMYGKCGSMTAAQSLLDGTQDWDLASWNTLSAGYAHQGDSERVFHLFQLMKRENLQPDGVSFLNLLTVCSHAGITDIGQHFFVSMIQEYGIRSTIKHQNCMIDLLGRAGQLDEAVLTAEKMPVEPDFVIWSTMLSACRKWGNIDLGKHSFDSALGTDDAHPGVYILMVNIYSDSQIWGDAMKVESIRSKEVDWTEAGQCCWGMEGIT